MCCRAGRRRACESQRPRRIHLHVHDLAVDLHEAVAYLQAGLEAEWPLLHRDHRLFEADGRAAHLQFAWRARGDALRLPHRAGCRARRPLQVAALHRPAGGERQAVDGQAGARHGLGEIEGLQGDVHRLASLRAAVAYLRHPRARRSAQRHRSRANLITAKRTGVPLARCSGHPQARRSE